MARAPFQVLVYPYRLANDGESEYALLKRWDTGYWQAVAGADEKIVLSREHVDYKWLTYEEARGLLKYDGNKMALWEPDRKLRGLGPRD